MTSYALVNAGTNPLLLRGNKSEDKESSRVTTGASAASDTSRAELISLFEYYAERYPNPRLVEEYRMTNELLQAASAAAHARSTTEKQPKQGFFARLFGSSPSAHSSQDKNKLAPPDPTDESLLLYTDVPSEDGASQEQKVLCGTQDSLDASCIPVEAYSVARFHLTSTRTRKEHPNTIQWGPMAGTSTPTSLVVVGLGILAEFKPNEESTLHFTSDREDLWNFLHNNAQHDGETFRLEYVRACALSPNCVAISWGLQDGLIGFYRRIKVDDATPQQAGPVLGWERLWIVGPSRSVLDAIADVFHDDESHPGSPLLKVADMVPLRVQTGDPRQPMIATLALARVGGYLELLPLPTDLWFGAPLDPRKIPPARRRPRGQHYAVGNQIGTPTLALTTAEYHIDITSLDALRTRVGSDTDWDQEKHPDGPPSEFVVAASGMSPSHLGYECITYWTISILFPTQDSENNSGQPNFGFQLHAALLEASLVQAGADVSFFCTPGILQHWRKPRHVALKPNTNPSVERTNETTESPSSAGPRITTLSTSAPVVRLHFQGIEHGKTPALAILDWNGGATILDCGLLERAASQQMEAHEYAKQQWLKEAGEPFPLIQDILSRTQMADAIQRKPIGNVQWLIGKSSELPEESPLRLSPLVLLLRGNPTTLSVVTMESPTQPQSEDGIDAPAVELLPSVVSLPFPAQGATMGDLGSGNLLFVSNRNVENGIVLKFFVMQQLQPTAIVLSLAREAKYAEAVASAQMLKDLDPHEEANLADVVEECHRKLWETSRDLESLEKSGNGVYIVEQALALGCGQPLGDEIQDSGMSVEKVRQLLQLALSKGSDSAPMDVLRQIASALDSLGTYELLCRHFGVETYLVRFQQDFLQASMVDVAQCLAERGDILGLSIVVFRHRASVWDNILDILGSLPLDIPPSEWVHLLPVSVNGSVVDSFLPAADGADFLHWSQMPQYLWETRGVAVVLDPNDEKSVLMAMSRAQTPIADSDWVSQVSDWYVERARRIQSFMDDLPVVILLCKSGLQCLGIIAHGTNSLERSRTNIAPEVRGLFRTWKSATLLQQIMYDGQVAFDTEETKESITTLTLSTEDLLTMDLPKLVNLILQGEMDPSKIQKRCTDYLQVLLPELCSQQDSDSKGASMDEALSSCCLGLANECILGPNIVTDVFKAVGTTAAIAAASATSIHKRDRLIKDKAILVSMVLEVIQAIAPALANATLETSDCRTIMDSIWTMYESLPDRIPVDAQGGSSLETLLRSVDDIYRTLVAVDILSRWPGSSPFELLVAQPLMSNAMFTNQKGIEVFTTICTSFTTAVTVPRGQESTMLLQDLLSDTQNMNTTCCQNSLDLPSLLCIHLIRPLLHLECFHLVVAFLEGDASLVDREQVKAAVLSYVDEAVFSESESSNQIMSAMKCQDIIGPAFPEIQHGFSSVRRYLDAAHFISTVIYEGKDVPPKRPADLRKQLPLDLIETIIREVPESIVCGCPQWRDEAYAENANARLRGSLDKVLPPEGVESQEMPVLPGGAIFHLATILGLDDSTAAVVVKCRVIQHALSAEIYGASAAICRTLVRGIDTEEGNAAIASAKLDVLIQLTSDSNYLDIATRQELCCAAIDRFSGMVDVSGTSAFDQLNSTNLMLDHQLSRYSGATQVSPERLRQLLSRPVARLQVDIQSEYNANIHGLFFDLQGQTADGCVHDSLMNALSRFVVYWCVSDSKNLKTRVVMREKTDSRENIALGCALILQIPSKLTAGNCIHELQKIASDQAANVATADRFDTDDSVCIPDPNLVKRLVGRGYSENAARRAVVMTGNTGYNEALGWAVTHTMDQDFNAPIVLLHDPRKTRVDERAIQLLQKSLYATERCLDEEKSMDALLAFLKSLHQKNNMGQETTQTSKTSGKKDSQLQARTGAPVKTTTRAPSASAPPALPKKPKEDERKPSVSAAPPRIDRLVSMHEKTGESSMPANGAQPNRAPPLPPSKKPPTAATPQKPIATSSQVNTSSMVTPTSKPASKILTPATKTVSKTTPITKSRGAEGLGTPNYSTPSNRPSRLPSTSSRKELLKKGQEALTKLRSHKKPGTKVAGSPLHPTKIPSPNSKSERQHLLKRGQEALHRARNGGQSTARSKLIEEGRRLLRSSNTQRKASTAQAARAGTIPPPPSKTTNGNDDDTDAASNTSGWDFDNFDDM